VVWGTNLSSTVGFGRFTKVTRDMVKLPPLIKEVIVGLLLGDGWLNFASSSQRNARFCFKQGMVHFAYFWSIWNLLSPPGGIVIISLV